MSYFFGRLLPPRPTFAQDITEEELKLMQTHGAYMGGLAEKGTAVLFGPVLEGKGGWGLVVFEAESESEVRALIAKDPVILSNRGFRYEIFPMLRAVLRKGL